jgi:hypothetical protein
MSGLASPRVVSAAGSLAGDLTLAGGGTLPLAALTGAVLVLIPPACHCGATVTWLADFGVSKRAPTFLVASTAAAVSEADQLASRLTASAQGNVAVALDAHADLQTAVPFSGLTVVLLSDLGAVSYARDLVAGESTVPLRQALLG